jgi:hypothetical protein
MASAMEQAPPEPRLGVSGMNLASASVGRSRDDMIAAMGARMDHVNIGYGHSEGRVIVPDASDASRRAKWLWLKTEMRMI